MITSISKLSFPIDFFCDEVREGFFVSETMKRYWAAQLKVLYEIDKICIRHNCNWFADFGTLLGAVRHKGFIPWDDDIDISMLRDEMELFLFFAREELPEGYAILDENVDGYNYPFCRIINTEVINNYPDFLNENFGCPFMAGVDIFPLDNIFLDVQKEENRVIRANYVFTTFKGLVSNLYSDYEIEERISKIERENQIDICRDNVKKGLLKAFSDISKECKVDDSEDVAVMYMWVSEGKHRYKRSFYKEWIDIPFETVKVRVPIKYHDILTLYYGDYHVIKKGTAIHNYPVYRCLEDRYREYFHRNPNRFSFEKDKYRPVKKMSIKQFLLDKIRELKSIHGKINDLIDIYEWEDLIIDLKKCKEIALSMKEEIGKKSDSNSIKEQIISYIESIDLLIQRHGNFLDSYLEIILDGISDSIQENFAYKRKEVIFFICKSDWWQSMREIFSFLSEKEDYHITVVSVPYFYRNAVQSKLEMIGEAEKLQTYSELSGKITLYENYKNKIEYSDMMFIQFPFDGESGIIGIPEQLHSLNLMQKTERLIYVPCFNPDPPECVDDVAYRAMQDLVEQPAVFYSDYVIVESEEIKKYYVSRLISMTDDSMRKYWEDKIMTKEYFLNKACSNF